MAGQNIARLRAAANGMNENDVEQSRGEWERGQTVLADVAGVLETSGRQVRDAFGAGSQIGIAAQEVLDGVRADLDKRSARMGTAKDTLVEVKTQIILTKSENATMPASAPGEPPRMEGGPYVDESAENRAMKIFAHKNGAYVRQVDAYNDADTRARTRVEELNAAYQQAGDVFAGMWEAPPAPPTTDGDGRTPTGGGHTRGPGVNPYLDDDTTVHGDDTGDTGDTGDTEDTGDSDTDDDNIDDGDNGGDGDDGDDNDVDNDGNDGSHDGGDSGDAGDGGGWGGGSNGSGSGLNGISVNPSAPGIVGGGAAAAFGAQGLRGLLGGSSASPSTAVPGQSTARPARPIGASGRTGAGGVLGRGGALAPGQATGRPGAGGTTGRRAGGRGGAGAGTGGRGRRKDEERDDQREGIDIEDEWTDDEGQFPGVIQ